MTNGSHGGLAYGFQIDWAAKTYSNIDIPEVALELGTNYFITIGDKFFLTRQSVISNYYSYSWFPYSIAWADLQ